MDNLKGNLRGYGQWLSEIDGVEVLACLLFEEALQWEGWSKVDWAVVDIANEEATEESIPAAPVVEHIRQCTEGSLQPKVLAITSRPDVADNDFVRARLVWADPDIGLLRRRERSKSAWRTPLPERNSTEPSQAFPPSRRL